MANITVTTTQEERNKVLHAISVLGEDKIITVDAIAKAAGLKPSKARYALLDLIDAGKVERIPVKAFNKHYTRYKYKLL